MKSMIPFGSRSLTTGEFNHLFDGLLGRPTTAVRALRPHIQLDFTETEEAYQVVAEVPGIAREDLEITVNDDLLVLSGEKKRVSEETGYRERVFGRFERKLRLALPVEVDQVHAETKDGVLTITLPKTEAVKPRRIEVAG